SPCRFRWSNAPRAKRCSHAPRWNSAIATRSRPIRKPTSTRAARLSNGWPPTLRARLSARFWRISSVTAAQLIARVKKGAPPAATLLLGPEAYERRRVKEAMMAAFPEGSVSQHDLTEISLAEALDDARSLSLFAAERLIWIVNAEAALPRGRAVAEDDEG